MSTLATRIMDFYTALRMPRLPRGVQVMNPYREEAATSLCTSFYTRYYNDNRPRKIILGINPGRRGGGVTGIPFTDPVKLQDVCGIVNDLPRVPELSADFIYRVVEAYGGPERFYGDFFIGAVCPLGFTLGGKNMNYYESKELQESVEPFIVKALGWQATVANHGVCFCLGEGKNFKYLSDLNQRHHFFSSLVALPHPRFIMQYRRKKVGEYVERYLSVLV